MKTAETQITIQQIKSIISPVRVLKVKEDFESIAELIWEDKQPQIEGVLSRRQGIRIIAYQLISRYESLTSQPLRKEMFVFQFPKVAEKFASKADEEAALKRCADEQKKIWFEGFEKEGELLFVKGSLRLLIPVHQPQNIQFMVHPYVFVLENPTVSDLIIEISRYNRTASKPVEINVTDSFIQELIK